jgi:hypothetical protein
VCLFACLFVCVIGRRVCNLFTDDRSSLPSVFFFPRFYNNQGGRGNELARSCRCGGGDPTHALPPRRRAVTQPSQLEAPSARGHATKCPVPPGAPRLLCLRSSPIESLVLASAPPVRRSVARLAAGKTSCVVRPRRMCACALKQATPVFLP